MAETDDITFAKRLLEDYYMLQSSKGDVIVLDRDGLTIYNVFKTLNFKADQYKVQTFYVEVFDEETLFFIMPESNKKQQGLNNDIVLRNKRKVRQLLIPEEDFTDLKNLMYKFTYDKLFPDD